MNKAIGALCAVAAVFAASQAQAVGCLSGAVVGGVAGHVAGKHAVAGAVAGCVVGHELAVHKKKQRLAEERAAKVAAQSGQQAPPAH